MSGFSSCSFSSGLLGTYYSLKTFMRSLVLQEKMGKKHERRLLETILHVTLLYLTVYDRQLKPSGELFTIIFVLTIFCYISERLRWQMVPLFLGYILYWYHYNAVSSVFALLGMILCIYLPVPKPLLPYKGAFEVGYFDYEYYGKNTDARKKGGDIAMGRLFYPTLQKRSYSWCIWPSSQSFFFHGDTTLLRALVKIFSADVPFLSRVPFLLDYWSLVTVPIKQFAMPIFSTSSIFSSLPVVVFSHGLSASRELNTSLCIELASMGFYVFAVEHTDGSCGLARFIDGTVIEYDFSQSDIQKQYGLNAFENARKKQTKIRVQNMKKHFDFIDKLNSGYFAQADSHHLSELKIDKASQDVTQDLVLKLRNGFDMKKLILSGKPAAVILLDPANQWMPENLLSAMKSKNGEKKPSGGPLLKHTPVLSIFSEIWYNNNTNNNYENMVKFSCGKYKNNSNSCVLAVKGSQHLGLCDIFSFLPNVVGKVIPYFKQNEDSYVVIKNVNRVVLNFLFQNNLAYTLSNKNTVKRKVGGGNVKKRREKRKEKNELSALNFVVGFEE
eukprot:g2619.t1